MNDKFCTKCGSALEPGAAFCLRCGQSVNGQPAQPQPSYTPIQQYNMNIKPKTPRIDVKKTVLSNIIPVTCLALGLVLVIIGLGVHIPSDYISSYSMTEYVGGDAYNFIVEAALRGGQIAGATAAKAVYIAAGLLTACVSALKVKLVKPEKENK